MSLDTPRLDRRFRLQWEEAQQRYVLLYPEGMVRLNDSAAQILTRCDGLHSCAQIIDELRVLFGGHCVDEDVRTFINHAAKRGWVC
ncbi:coenzyme PQQ biosynthesis protein D [Pandoraea terrae]|uniref:Coenzyme PQQ biosynthesis protein D n=1 Tax=Pandoraea terrae TaxID=1537710 RepID=A0A5E4TJC1_9BURK|nr:pyrroloquinoline quinone biosynthesis peptide chaperone PqqD [Pandoraea terrae]VVD87183.1 coenzyme PQQ biosynthesis protein D [Pandoraea terrae]